jgi:hypothetical protein
MTLAAAMLAASAFALPPAAAQENGSLMLKLGTTFTYEGVKVREGSCWEYEPYQQYGRVAGRVILPDTQANMYNFIEYWGRDRGTQVLRYSPNGEAFGYFGGKEYVYAAIGSVGTSFEMTDPESGEALRLVIAQVGISVTLPTGVVYDNLTRMNMYCLSCGPEPALMESRWYSRENPFGVLFKAENPPCGARWHWLVSITTR